MTKRGSDCTHQQLKILHFSEQGNSLVLEIFHQRTHQTTKNYFKNVHGTVKDESNRMDVFTNVSQSQDHLERGFRMPVLKKLTL